MLLYVIEPFEPMVATLHTQRPGNPLSWDAQENHFMSYGPSLFLLNCSVKAV